jgi:hypothetical protein
MWGGAGQKPLKLGMLQEHTMLLLDLLDPNYEDFLTVEDFKLIVETLVLDGILRDMKYIHSHFLKSASKNSYSLVGFSPWWATK